jgi:hypothetical protein
MNLPFELKAIVWMVAIPFALFGLFPLIWIIRHWPRPKCCECGKRLRLWGRSRMCPSRHIGCQAKVIERLMLDESMRPSVVAMMHEWKKLNHRPGEYVFVQPEHGEPIVFVE